MAFSRSVPAAFLSSLGGRPAPPAAVVALFAMGHHSAAAAPANRYERRPQAPAATFRFQNVPLDSTILAVRAPCWTEPFAARARLQSKFNAVARRNSV